jgi:malonyl CoA-acyl carrier protein transacylase
MIDEFSFLLYLYQEINFKDDTMTVYLFPGQGSQVHGMGKELFSEFPEYLKKANQILDYDISILCTDDPEQNLNKTQFTQPALFIVNALTYLKMQKTLSIKPNFLLGHSLGEYNALWAAQVFDFETGLKLVKKRGELMSRAKNGSMAAIIGLPIQTIEAVIQQHALSATIANYNSYTQTVITGINTDIEKSISIFEKEGALLAVPLKVSGAFHSSYMQDAEQSFAEYLKSFTFSSPNIPVIANLHATPYSEDIANTLTKQMTHPVKWTHSIEYVIKQGETQFTESGPGTVLSNLVKKIQKGQ